MLTIGGVSPCDSTTWYAPLGNAAELPLTSCSAIGVPDAVAAIAVNTNAPPVAGGAAGKKFAKLLQLLPAAMFAAVSHAM